MESKDEGKTLTKITLTSLSAMVAETCTFPIDITKTRLQLHRHSFSSSSSISAFKVASETVRLEGPLSLYNGLSPAILRHLFYTPIRIVSYEYLRNVISADSTQSLSVFSKAFLGGFSGVIAQEKALFDYDDLLFCMGLTPQQLHTSLSID